MPWLCEKCGEDIRLWTESGVCMDGTANDDFYSAFFRCSGCGDEWDYVNDDPEDFADWAED